MLRGDAFFRAEFGDRFIDYLLMIKQSEVNRYLESIGGEENLAERSGEVTDWEQREYFELF